MSKRFETWMLGLAAVVACSGVLCQSVAAQEKAPLGKPATARGATEKAAAETPLLTIGSKAPPLDIEHWMSNGNGKFKPVTKFTPGRVYVVEFWATWCGPCIASMPHLAAMQAKYLNKGVQIVSISDEDAETVQSFLKTPVRSSQPDSDAKDGEKDAKAGKTENAPKQTYAAAHQCLLSDDGSGCIRQHRLYGSCCDRMKFRRRSSSARPGRWNGSDIRWIWMNHWNRSLPTNRIGLHFL